MNHIKAILLFTLFACAGFQVTAAPLEDELTTQVTEQVSGININTADVETLMTLPGIGMSKANAIIAFRNENGSFISVEDLIQVKGIGEKILSKLKDKIMVQ